MTTVQDRAYAAVAKARRTGLLTRQPCAVCDDEPAQAHHHRGYGEEHVLDVVWLCQVHHTDAHYPRRRHHFRVNFLTGVRACPDCRGGHFIENAVQLALALAREARP